MEFRKNLILTFFMKYGNEYKLSDVAESLGIGYEEINGYLQKLIEDRLIKYDDYLITLTKNGIEIAKELFEDNVVSSKINEKKVINIEHPYMTKKMSRKIKV